MTSAEILPPAEAVTRRSWRALPWCFSAVALTFVVAVVLEGSLRDPAWRWAVIVVGFSAAAGATRSRLPLPFVLISCLAAVRLGTAGVPENGGPPGGPWELAVNVALAIAMCLMALMTFQYRSGRLGTRDAVDGLAVLLGSGVVAWTVVANPLIEDDRTSTVTALAVAAYLPLTSLLLVLTIDVAFSGLSRNRTVMFATAAASTHLVATWIWALEVTGVLGPVARDLGVAGNAAALCFLGAAMTHRDAPRSLRPIDPTQGDSDTMIRVVIMGVSVIVPLALVASIAPTSPVDIVVRAIGITALVVAIIVRLQIATRQSRESRETLLQQVTRDDLTKLPNRSRFVDVVAEILESTWHSPQRATVIQLNLDRFKNINDTFGHYAANQVLIAVGERLASIAEPIDATVARVGGDDFALVHTGLTCPEEAIAFAEALRAAVTTPVPLGDANVFVTASIGAALAPRNRTTAAEDLVRHADIAAHQAKQNGRNRVELFDESMQARLTRRMDVENALHGAIGRREMRLFHQPIVDITTGRISGFEALLRWERQDGTFVSPADFIPVAEETGVIFELGAWALRDALTSLRRWIDDGLVPPSATMSVNVSPRQVADPGFPAVVRATIAETGVPPHLVWLEITESMMLDEPEVAARALDEIRSTGVRIAMDDFGTGYSSLSVLQQFPIQRIKIDRAFVNGLGEHGDDRSLVRTIIAMARSMALDLVAEGVETIDQLEGLRQLGCDKAQGFLISRPVPADAMRSTMVALEEMADLSLFASPEPADAGADALDDATNDESTTEQSPTRPRAPQFAVAGHLSPMSSRPLGGPHV